MDRNQLKAFCSLFYASHYVPIFIYRDSDLPEYACTAIDDLTPAYFVRKNLTAKHPPNCFFTSETGMWGRITIPALDCAVIYGPVFSGDISLEMVYGFMNWHGFPLDRLAELTDFLRNIPKYSYYGFLNMLAFLHNAINNEVIDLVAQFDSERVQYDERISNVQTAESINSMEEVRQHGTYALEQQLQDIVREGDVASLRAFLSAMLNTTKIQEGKLAENPIRQAKNIFIGAATMFGKSSAIQGGLDVEETYQLIDAYVQECERVASVEAITALQYNMLIDFTSRVAENKIPAGISADIHACIQFISNHTNEPIGIDEVAAHIGKSRAYLTPKFKKETGKTVNTFILDKKLAVSKSLLKHTNKALSDIACFLSFSSQAYYQKLFKQKYGETPGAYRNRFVQNW
jgi:AraC-like DNA-binding protein